MPQNIPPTRFSAISPFSLRTFFFQNGPDKKNHLWETPWNFEKWLILVINKTIYNKKKLDDSWLSPFFNLLKKVIFGKFLAGKRSLVAKCEHLLFWGGRGVYCAYVCKNSFFYYNNKVQKSLFLVFWWIKI